MTRLKDTIAATVREVVRTRYQSDYCSLCHVFAIVGANLASIVLDRAYKPVAGLAAIDAGAGNLIYMADNQAFDNPVGGSYHCWIESCDEPSEQDKEILDFTFGHNRMYALKNRLPWFGAAPPRYLWGSFNALVLGGELHDLRPGFGKEKIWLQETDEGVRWMAAHLNNNINAYVNLTATALKIFRKKYPAAMATPALHGRSEPVPFHGSNSANALM